MDFSVLSNIVQEAQKFLQSLMDKSISAKLLTPLGQVSLLRFPRK